MDLLFSNWYDEFSVVLFIRYFNMIFVIIIINYDYCLIALYKMNCIVLLLLYMYIVYYSPLNFWIYTCSLLKLEMSNSLDYESSDIKTLNFKSYLFLVNRLYQYWSVYLSFRNKIWPRCTSKRWVRCRELDGM